MRLGKPMKDQPGLSTNLPWLLKDENTLEDETKRESETGSLAGQARKVCTHTVSFPDVTPPGNSWEGVSVVLYPVMQFSCRLTTLYHILYIT